MSELNKREFLKVSGFTAALTALSACRLLSPTIDPTSPIDAADPLITSIPKTYDDDWLIRRTLHRISFGAKSEDIAYAKEIGLDITSANNCPPILSRIRILRTCYQNSLI